MNHSSYVVKYTENADFMSHYTVANIVHLPERSQDLTLSQLRTRAQADLQSTELHSADLSADDVVIEFSRDIVQKFVCSSCNQEEEKFAAQGSIPFEASRCPRDGQLRAVISVHSYSGTEDFGSRRLSDLGLPLLDLFVARHGDREIGYIPYGDAPLVLGALAPKQAAP